MDQETPSPQDEKSNGPLVEIDPQPTPEKEASAEFSDPDHRAKHLHNQQFAQNIRERRRYGLYSYRIARIWVCFLVTITFSQFLARLFGAGLEANEFITVVSTTTASVLGFWWLVGRYLFKAGGSEHNEKSN